VKGKLSQDPQETDAMEEMFTATQEKLAKGE